MTHPDSAKDTKQLVIEVRLRIEVDAGLDKDEAARRWFREARQKPGSHIMEHMRIVDVEVEDPYGFMLGLEGWRYRDLTDEE